MNIADLYGEDYFIRGADLGLSNYRDYRWLPEQTHKMAKAMIALLEILESNTVCDIGCARGFLVRALRENGIEAFGHDLSRWAIEHCDPLVTDYVSREFPVVPYDFFTMKDIVEHIPVAELSVMLGKLLGLVLKSILIIVPLSSQAGGPYVRKEDNMDSTHLIRWPLESWLDYITSLAHPNKFLVSASWHYPGLKPSSATHPKSCGFLLITKI